MRQLTELTPVDVAMQWDVRIPLRDGAQLSATSYLPKSGQSFPAIFVFTPYIRQIHHDQGIYFATHGYPFLTVDVRGRGDSEGEFHPLNDAREDACDIVEWIARQPYCNGQVAMWGGSCSGYLQWMAAKGCPPESIEDACLVTVRLFHDNSHPSALYVPFGRSEFESHS